MALAVLIFSEGFGYTVLQIVTLPDSEQWTYVLNVDFHGDGNGERKKLCHSHFKTADFTDLKIATDD